MKIAFFDTHTYDHHAFNLANVQSNHELIFFDEKLSSTTVMLAKGFEVVCVFVNDKIDRDTLKILSENGTKLIALRCAGFNNVDLNAAKIFNIKVVRVPEYSPFAVAEHVVALILTLNRKIHRAYNRVREGNFSLDGLVGFDLSGKTFGILGVGKIGKVLARIMTGFGCKVLLYDHVVFSEFEKEINAQYTDLNSLFKLSDIISLNLPLNPQTKHCINDDSIFLMKKGVLIVNTGRGGLIDTSALIRGLKSGHIGGACLDVYEEEEGFFFQDHSGQFLTDDILARLLTFPNVLITGHQAFLTNEALQNMAEVTLKSVTDFEQGKLLKNEIF